MQKTRKINLGSIGTEHITITEEIINEGVVMDEIFISEEMG